MDNLAYLLVALIAAAWVCIAIDNFIIYTKRQRSRREYLERLDELSKTISRAERERREGGRK